MAEGKKAFVLYCDLKEVFQELSDQDAGQLIKHILQYVNDENPVTDNPVVKISFIPIKLQLKRDLKKWEAISKKNQDNANKRWHTKNATASDRIPKDAKNADTVTVTVTDSNTMRESGVRPGADYFLDLPEIKIGSAIEYLSITKKIKADRTLINSLWTFFKQKNFTGENFYKSDSDIFRHFFETLKFEKINGTHQRTPVGNSKVAGSHAVYDYLEHLIKTSGGTGQANNPDKV